MLIKRSYERLAVTNLVTGISNSPYTLIVQFRRTVVSATTVAKALSAGRLRLPVVPTGKTPDGSHFLFLSSFVPSECTDYKNLIFMAGKLPQSSALSWVFVIEALANFEQVDVTTLINVVNSSPKITNDIGEIVSFRVLERLFDPDTRPIKSGVSFDFSEQCQDVLQYILKEMDSPNVWDESEKSKWDVDPFIAYKRSCLLKSDSRRVHMTTIMKQIMSLNPNDVKSCQDNEGSRKGECFDDVARKLNEKDGDDEWYHKELNDTFAKKQTFFSSNYKNGELSTHSKERNRCMKCNEGGQLLICSSDSCLFVFHDTCLVSTSETSQTTEKFYCPFCKYSQAISDYRKVKRKASLARNDLVSFNGLALKRIPNMPLKKSCVSDENADSIISFRKQVEPCTSLPLRRRVHVPWTKLEEDTLKKWMEKLSGTSSDGCVPWRKILELGVSVFQKGRKPVDLKDKWRNMQKASRNYT